MAASTRTLTPLLAILAVTGAHGQANQAADANKEKPEEILLRLTNQARSERKLTPLKLNETLSQAAIWMAQDMAEYNYFAHEDRLKRQPDKRIEEFGYANWTTVSENIAGGASDVAEAFKMWMKSPGHRKNILDPDIREMGFGYASNPKSKYLKYWVQTFGARR